VLNTGGFGFETMIFTGLEIWFSGSIIHKFFKRTLEAFQEFGSLALSRDSWISIFCSDGIALKQAVDLQWFLQNRRFYYCFCKG
jgi:hypothetical protein